MKKLAVLILLSGCLVLAGCGKKDTTTSSASVVTSDSSAKSAETISVPASSDLIDTENTDQPEGVTITPGIIYEDENIRVTSENIDSDSSTTYLFATFENLTDKDVLLSCEDAFVNNCLAVPDFTIELEPKGSLSAGIGFENSDLNTSEITQIADLTFRLSASDPEDFSALFTTDWIDVQTSAYDSYEQTVNEDGTVLYDKDGIKLINAGYTSQDGINAPVLLCINASGKTMMVDTYTLPDLAALDAGEEMDEEYDDSAPYLLSYSYELPDGKNVRNILGVDQVTASDYESEEGLIDDEQLYEDNKSAFDEAAEDTSDEDESYSEITSSELAEMEAAENASVITDEDMDDTSAEDDASYEPLTSVDCVFVFTDTETGKEIGRTGNVTFKLE